MLGPIIRWARREILASSVLCELKFSAPLISTNKSAALTFNTLQMSDY